MPNTPTIHYRDGISFTMSDRNWVTITRRKPGQSIWEAEKLGWFHKDSLHGKTAAQIVTFCAQVQAAHVAVRAKFDAFKASLPVELQDKVSYGYIGNFESWGDDTSWRLFYNVPQERFGQSAGGYSQARMPEFLANWDRHEAFVRAKLTQAYGVDVTKAA